MLLAFANSVPTTTIFMHANRNPERSPPLNLRYHIMVSPCFGCTTASPKIRFEWWQTIPSISRRSFDTLALQTWSRSKRERLPPARVTDSDITWANHLKNHSYSRELRRIERIPRAESHLPCIIFYFQQDARKSKHIHCRTYSQPRFSKVQRTIYLLNTKIWHL